MNKVKKAMITKRGEKGNKKERRERKEEERIEEKEKMGEREERGTERGNRLPFESSSHFFLWGTPLNPKYKPMFSPHRSSPFS